MISLLRLVCLLPLLVLVSCGKQAWVGGQKTPAAHSGRSEADLEAVQRVPLPNGYEVARVERGIASWYGGKFHGRRTASGERYNKYAMTAAHKKLPFGTLVRVTREHNGHQVIVRINDRGPFVRGRIIDVSKKAAKQLDMIGDGIGKVTVEVLRKSEPAIAVQGG